MDINALTKEMIENNLEQDPEKWGPHTWATLHSFALRSDTLNTIDTFNTFLTTLEVLIPCTKCRNDFKIYIQTLKPQIGKAFQWTVDFHNHVNKKLGKPILNFVEATKLWNSNSCQYTCTQRVQKNNNKTLMFFVILVLALFLYYRWKSLVLF